jgi:hypothetical protein
MYFLDVEKSDDDESIFKDDVENEDDALEKT